MPKKYEIQPILWRVKDEASVKFHVESNDYFGTIATVLSLLEQKIKKDGPIGPELEKTLACLESDLLFLQKNYRIRPAQIKARTKNKKMMPKGRLSSQ